MMDVHDHGGIAFGCTACGRCCNSPPRLSLPELFGFQHVFIGCLAVARLSAGGHADRMALLDRLAVRAPGPGGATHIAIMPQGYGYDADPHCPALAQDGGCSLHSAGKPLQCRAVPLDPLSPDALQGLVLRERMADAAFANAGCLATGADAARALLTQDCKIVDPDFAGSITARRDAIANDTAIWGRSVAAALLRQGLPNLPPGGYIALPVTSALLMVAGISNACRERCLGYIDAQLPLLGFATERARTLRRPLDRPTTKRLESWAVEYRGLRDMLAEPPASWPASADTQKREAWLGLTANPVAADFRKPEIPTLAMA